MDDCNVPVDGNRSYNVFAHSTPYTIPNNHSNQILDGNEQLDARKLSGSQALYYNKQAVCSVYCCEARPNNTEFSRKSATKSEQLHSG